MSEVLLLVITLDVAYEGNSFLGEIMLLSEFGRHSKYF